MTRTRTFIIPGDESHLPRIIRLLNKNVCGILLHQTTKVSELQLPELSGVGFSGSIFTLDSLTELTTRRVAEQHWVLYEKCLREVLSDPRAHYLATRSRFDSAFNNVVLIEKTVINSVSIIQKTKLDRLLCSSTPHSLEAWVLSKCCESLGIPVFIFERTPINNRAWIYRGVDDQQVLERSARSPCTEVTEYTRQLVRAQQEARPGARDEHGYYISRMDLSSIKGADSHKWWSSWRELRALLSGRLISLPIRLASVYLKYRLYRSYIAAATRDLPGTPFVIYFMHYQPERTSLPEGGWYVQQWMVIRLLSGLLPDGWTLLVREHPTIWLMPLDISIRTANLYREISSLPNTKLCSMDIDTFEIIDKSSAVATLTGKVGFQAILRKTPVLALGSPPYKDHPGCYWIRSADDLVNAYHALEAGEGGDCFSDENLQQYLLWIEQNSLMADESEEDLRELRLKNFAQLYEELLCEEV